jgi:multiple PDZ domain protein
VKTLVESEAVARDGRIQVGDYIVSVNTDSLRRVTNAQARAVLRKASLLTTDVR